MHISIADAEEVADAAGARTAQPMKYVFYNIHINGTYHCSARFSQLETLNKKLMREFGAGCLEKFPLKNFFYMKPEECNERRYQLQVWLQKIAQQPRIVQGTTFQDFLLNAQKEVQKGPEEDVQLEVYLANGKRITVDIVSTDQTEEVLETVCLVLELEPALTYYFGLYLVDDLDGNVMIRKLQDFESPSISLQRAEPHQKIQLRKAYWNIDFDKLLWDSAVALNLVYIEIIAELKNGHIKPKEDAADHLAESRSNRDRKAFLELARKQPGYGFAQFGEATTNWPEDNSSCLVSLGNPGDGNAVMVLTEKVHQFFVQRMRCWRTYTVDEGVEMEFEYLVEGDESKNKMRWIKMLSPQTIHCAMCLQFLVEEMVRVNHKKPIKKPSDRTGKFKPRRQSNQPADLSFLTSDTEGAAAGQPVPSTPSVTSMLSAEGLMNVFAPAAPKISVTLSDLMAKVKADEDAYEARTVSLSTAVRNDINEGLDADDDDDPRNNFAALAGL